MIISALTGSIGMGKSTTAAMFRSIGAPVFDADAFIHEHYERGGRLVEPVRRLFPEAVIDDRVDRTALSRLVLNDDDALKRLEAAVHPIVASERKRFIWRERRRCAPFVVLDIPLLFETGADRLVDVVIVASAPEDVQRARVLEREGMTQAKLAAILAKQVPDSEKRARADFIVETGAGYDHARRQVLRIARSLARTEARRGGWRARHCVRRRNNRAASAWRRPHH